MTAEALDAYRASTNEIAERIASTWERRRAHRARRAGLSDADRQAVTAQCEAALEPFVVETDYEVPCVALRAVAR